MFPGSFRAKLNSRFHRGASAFATTVVALHPSLLSPYPLLTYAYFVKYDDWQKSKEPDLSCLCVVRHRPCSELSCKLDGTPRHALSELAGVWDGDCIYIATVEHGGKGEIVWLCNKDFGDVPLLLS